jgi:hypothetical protein
LLVSDSFEHCDVSHHLDDRPEVSTCEGRDRDQSARLVYSITRVHPVWNIALVRLAFAKDAKRTK